LSMISTGNDPYMVSSAFEFPAEEYSRIDLTIKVSPGTPTSGEIFYLTDSDLTWDENKYLFFDLINDGEFHTYHLDMSRTPGWKGFITQLRIDPVISEGRVIEIDQIGLTP